MSTLNGKSFKDMLLTVFDEFSPVITKRKRGKFSSWLSAEMKSHINIRDKLMQKARKSSVNPHREDYKWKRNKVNIMIRKAKSDYTRTLLPENSRNPDGFGAAIKRVFP